MQPQQYLHRVVNRMDPSRNVLLNMTSEEAETLVGSGQADAAGRIEGQFAICCQRGRLVYLARSIGRPMRYFLAKKSEGPCLYVAESMKEIFRDLQEDGLSNQFHPSYTRMVPAHYLVRLELIGCPDPNPKYDRFFTPERNI
ncbi:MAG: asparagine synthetase B family protein, partial [Pirellulaceae bacterium]